MQMHMKLGVIFIVLMVFVSFSITAGTLRDIKRKGYLTCGVNGTLPGFSYQSSSQLSGIDADFCRAVAAAIFGSRTAKRVKFKKLSAKERFVALQSGAIDLLARNTTWTATRDNSLGLEFVGVNFYDGQGFVTKKSLDVKTLEDLDGADICIIVGTTHEKNVADYFKKNDMDYTPRPYEDEISARQAYEFGRCDAYTKDHSALASQLSKMQYPQQHLILAETISKEPLGPVVREDDRQWVNIVRWVLFAMINAEELGITRENAIRMYKYSTSPTIKRFLGKQGSIGLDLGLSKKWAMNVIRAVGNYGEAFKNNITQLKIERGLNKLWSDGGILYAPPLK